MDDQRFDALVRALGSGSSRRTILSALRAATLGGALSLLGRDLGQAARGKKNRARQEKKRGRKDRARAVSAQQLDDESAAKVGLCHRTGSEKNPFRFIEVSANAVPAHAAHGDLVACPGAGVIDSETCTCVCPLTEDDCPGNVVVDEDLCACVCPVEDITCPNLEVVDPDTCECFCPVDDIVCDPGETLNLETCECESGDGGNQPCETFVCGFGACAERPNASPPNCFCFELTDEPGTGRCLGNYFCGSTPPCNSDADCPQDFSCTTNTCCGLGVQACAPPCPEIGTTALGTSAEGSGPTAGGT
jgi:hypothetical protein